MIGANAHTGKFVKLDVVLEDPDETSVVWTYCVVVCLFRELVMGDKSQFENWTVDGIFMASVYALLMRAQMVLRSCWIRVVSDMMSTRV